MRAYHKGMVSVAFCQLCKLDILKIRNILDYMKRATPGCDITPGNLKTSKEE